MARQGKEAMGKEAKKTVTKKPKDEAVKEMPKDTAAEVKPKEDGGNKKRGDALPPPPPLPEEVEMRVYMHCEGCAKKVKKILKHFDGVEDVIADSKAQKVVVKGKKATADPMKVVVHVQKKSKRKVELISPILSVTEEKKEEAELPKPVEKELPMIVVVLKVHIHCEVCARWITKRILKMRCLITRVQSAEPDINASEVTVKGVFEEAKLPRYVYRRTGKHATIIKSELVAPRESVCGEDKDKDQGKKVDDGEVDNVDIEDATSVTGSNMYMYYPQFAFPSGYYPPPPPPGYFYQPVHQPLPYAEHVPHYQMMAPQIFSDENPNACSVM